MMDNIADLLETEVNPHYLHSVLRERIVEHIFVGEILRTLWRRKIMDAEVLRSEFDAGGYDLVMGRQGIVRHIQLKTMTAGGKTSNVKVGLKLAEKLSGCVIGIIVTPDLQLDSYLWFGGAPGEPLPDIGSMKIAKHTKANAQGKKNERLNHRLLPRNNFEQLKALDDVLIRLFGPL